MSMSGSGGYVSRRRVWRRYSGGLLMAGFMLATLVSVAVLLILLITILVDGIPTLDWQFITSYDSSRPERAGILAGLVGTIWVVGIAAVICCPLGVATALFLEEFAPRNWLTTAIQINISNLAGVPSIIYGLVGFAVFVQLIFDGQRGVIAGSVDIDATGTADSDHHGPGDDPDGAAERSSGGLRDGCHEVAGGQAHRPSAIGPWDFERCHPGVFAGDWRDGTDPGYIFYRYDYVPPGQHTGSLHDPAVADIQLHSASAGGVPRPGIVGDHCVTGCFVDYELVSDHNPQPL